MIELLLTLIAAPPAQEVQATLQSCQQEEGRWVCRYRMPEVRIVPMAADDPAMTEPPVAIPPAAVAVAPPSAPVDPGVLSDDEARLVLRCAEADWLSLCLPHERREARALRDQAQVYETLRRDVARQLGEGECDGAVRTALAGGSLALARQAREFCATAAPQGSAASASAGTQ